MVTEPDNMEEPKPAIGASLDEELDEEGVYDQPPPSEQRDITKLEIDVREDPFQIAALIRKLDRDQILIPDFQRRVVWTPVQRSQFIESILLNYPLPPLFFNQDRQGRYLIIDGLQRTTAINDFLKNQYPLTALPKLPWLNGKRYSDLEPIFQARIEDRKLSCYVLKPSVPISVVHDIFHRINRGGTPLNRQEIRNGIYQGPAIELLKTLASGQLFSTWLSGALRRKRMGDEEAVLRCLAFVFQDPEKEYRGSMDDFLAGTLRRMNAAPLDDLEQYRVQFEATLPAIRNCLGEDAFRIRTAQTRGHINLAVMETVYRFFALISPTLREKNDATLRNNYLTMITNPRYLAAVRLATGDLSRVRDRFRISEEFLGKGLC